MQFLPLSLTTGSVGWAAARVGNPKCLFSVESKWAFACSGLDVEATGGVVPLGMCCTRGFFCDTGQPYLLVPAPDP